MQARFPSPCDQICEGLLQLPHFNSLGMAPMFTSDTGLSLRKASFLFVTIVKDTVIPPRFKACVDAQIFQCSLSLVESLHIRQLRTQR